MGEPCSACGTLEAEQLLAKPRRNRCCTLSKPFDRPPVFGLPKAEP
jgi:hypothetical protein